jgi:hypothetical protein
MVAHAHNLLLPRCELSFVSTHRRHVVTVHIDRWDVTKILIDNSSLAEILFLAAFDKMGFD